MLNLFTLMQLGLLVGMILAAWWIYRRSEQLWHIILISLSYFAISFVTAEAVIFRRFALRDAGVPQGLNWQIVVLWAGYLVGDIGLILVLAKGVQKLIDEGRTETKTPPV